MLSMMVHDRSSAAPPPRLALALLGYLLFITAVITLLPFNFRWPSRPIVSWGAGHPPDIVANVFLFLPLGFLYQLARGENVDRWGLRALAIGSGLSLCIELAQLLMAGRYTALTDLVANGTGAWAGALLCSPVKQRVNERLTGQLALELPLMTLFYLLTPLLWLNALAAGGELSRQWLAPLPGLVGAGILASVWTHRLRPKGVLSANALALIAGLWFVAAAVPGLLKMPGAFAACALTIAAAVRLLTAAPFAWGRRDRRFELPTLLRVGPLYIAYLGLLALWPWSWQVGPWQASIGFGDIPARFGPVVVLRVVEYFVAFTLFGYMTAESLGRVKELASETAQSVLVSSLVVGVVLELMRGFHPGQSASLARLALAVADGLYGALLYRLQLATVRRLLSTMPRQEAPNADGGRAVSPDRR